jgi:DNA-directed RNA polymerase specialized sigma24 family protein
VNRAQKRAAEKRAAKVGRRLGPARESPRPTAAQPPVVAKAAPPADPPRVRELDLLLRLRRAADRRAEAERELIAAMQQAREQGMSFARIGGAVDVSAQAVRQRLLRT